MQFTLVLGLIFALLVTIFAVSNSGEVIVRFPGGPYHVSQAIVIIGSAVFGAVTVALFGFFKHVKSSIKIWENQKKIKKLEDELKTLKEKNKTADHTKTGQNNNTNKSKEKSEEIDLQNTNKKETEITN